MTVLAARFRSPEGEIRVGRVEEDVILDAGPSTERGFIPDRRGWESIATASGTEYPLGDLSLLIPVVPSKVLCIGLNYKAHARESNMDVPTRPLIFSKLTSALIGHEEMIVVPAQEAEPDFEAEVAVIMGATARCVSADNALERIGGITAFNDVSGRSAQFGDGQWTRGKGYDTFGPIGPYVADSSGLHLGDLGLRCTVSGSVLQEARTSDLVFPVASLVAYLSEQFTLYPGDVICTGTPSGVGAARTPPRFLQDGDVVEVWVEGVGTLRNRVVRPVAGDGRDTRR